MVSDIMIKCFALSLTLLMDAEAFVPVLTSTASTFMIRSPTIISKIIREHEDATKLYSEKEVGYRNVREDSDVCDTNEEYCVVDKKSGKLIRLTVAEKERIFLDSLQSYYVSGRQLLPDDQFDLLKEDLSWSGSKLVQMNRNEAKYLSAMEAYFKGDPIMSDSEFDALKATLKEEKSQFAVSTEPKCYIDTGICTVTMKEDFFRTNLLYLPVGAILSLIWLGLGFEIIEPFITVNPLLLVLLGSPLIYVGTTKITNDFVFTNNKIVYGPCPSCEVEQRVFFGDILGVEGFGDVASLKCSTCKIKFDVQRDSMRASTLPPK